MGGAPRDSHKYGRGRDGGGNINSPPSMPSYRFQAKSVFLTYPQCSLSKEDCLHFLNTKFVTKNVETVSYAISREKHKDEGLHLHAVFVFNKRFSTTDTSFFDLPAGGADVYHPNIQTPKNIKNVVDYVIKDGDFIIGTNKTNY